MKEEKTAKKTKKDQQIEEYTHLLKKVQADFENYKKRVEKEKQEYTKFACEEMIKELLPALDSFELAIRNNPSKDIEALYAQLWHILETKGLNKIIAKDQLFDPYLHEALLQQESEKKENTILEVLQTGYKLYDKVIRHAKVKIAKNADNENSKE